MSGETDRDQSVDRVLRRTRGSRSDSDAGIPDGCLDAETLAAWADGELPSNERAAAEQHAADCTRCQAMLAALVRTTPETAPARPWWRPSGLGWLVPLAATAAAVGIWIAVPELPHSRPPESAARPADAVSPSSVPPASSLPGPAAPPALPTAPAPAPTPSAQPDTAERRARDSRADARANQLSPPAAAAAPPPAQAFREEAAQAKAVPPPAAAAPSAPPSPSAPSRAFDQTTANSGAKLADASAVVEIVSPDPMSRWRITGRRSVERSSDGGATWQPQQAGATSDLVAGSSPSPTVCWLVGRAGLVLLTIDGRQWRPVVFPVPADLSAVSASDARTAVVTTSDGRSFRTSDAGQTWAP